MASEIAVKQANYGLRANCLSFPEILAQSIANIAPTLTPTVNAALVFGLAGNATWFTYVVATVGLVFVGISINQFASRSATHGSLYAYIAQGLGPMAGVLTGWSLILAYIFTAIAVASGFVNYLDAFLSPLNIHVPAFILYAICIGAAWFVAYKDIQLSTVVMLGLEALSVGLILILGFIVIFKKGYVIDPAQLTFQGVKPSGIFTGLVLAVFSYVGFESATTLGDEAKNPLKLIPRSVILSTVASGLFFIIISYIEIIGFEGLPVTFDKSAAPLTDLANAAGVGIFGVVITIGAMVSFFACTLASINAGSRVLFGMGRHGIFHNWVGQAHGTNETPHIAVTLTALTTFVAPALTTIGGVKVLDNYGYFGTVATYGFLVAYILIAIASVRYLAKENQLKLQDVVVAAAAVLFMAVPVLGSIGIPGDSGLSQIFAVPAAPYNVFPYYFFGYLAIGAAWFIYLRIRSPQLIQEMEADIEDTHTRFSDMHHV